MGERTLRLRWGIVLIALVMSIVAIGMTASAAIEYDQMVFDETMDIGGGNWQEAQTHTEVDIVRMAAFGSSARVTFQMDLVGDASDDAIYSVQYLVDNMYYVTLEARDGDNFTGQDDRNPELVVTGSMFGEIVTWYVSLDDVNATYSMVLGEAKAENPTEAPTVYKDSCEWTESDLLKGLVSLEVYYLFRQSGEAKREVKLDFEDQAAAGMRYWIDDNRDRYLTQQEIDSYIEQLLVDLNWTDMTVEFKHHTSKVLTFEYEIYPGPICYNYITRMEYELELVYPKPPRDEFNVRWELELGNSIIPYSRATDASWFRVGADVSQADTDHLYRFGQWDMSELEKTFYRGNFTQLSLNGTQLRTHWNTSMRDDMGFTVFREEQSPDPDDDPCSVSMAIIIVPAGFVAFSGWRGTGRRRHPGQ